MRLQDGLAGQAAATAARCRPLAAHALGPCLPCRWLTATTAAEGQQVAQEGHQMPEALGEEVPAHRGPFHNAMRHVATQHARQNTSEHVNMSPGCGEASLEAIWAYSKQLNSFGLATGLLTTRKQGVKRAEPLESKEVTNLAS